MFLLLNGMGIAFLLYVLANFWNEGRRASKAGGMYRRHFLGNDRPAVYVVTRTISRGAPGGLHVIPFHSRERGMHGNQQFSRSAETAEVIPIKQFSTR